jgi:membrane-bound ClpP family serine protease
MVSMRYVIGGIILCLMGIVLIEIAQTDYGLILFVIGIVLVVWVIFPGSTNNKSNRSQ